MLTVSISFTYFNCIIQKRSAPIRYRPFKSALIHTTFLTNRDYIIFYCIAVVFAFIFAFVQVVPFIEPMLRWMKRTEYGPAQWIVYAEQAKTKMQTMYKSTNRFFASIARQLHDMMHIIIATKLIVPTLLNSRQFANFHS